MSIDPTTPEARIKDAVMDCRDLPDWVSAQFAMLEYQLAVENTQ